MPKVKEDRNKYLDKSKLAVYHTAMEKTDLTSDEKKVRNAYIFDPSQHEACQAQHSSSIEVKSLGERHNLGRLYLLLPEDCQGAGSIFTEVCRTFVIGWVVARRAIHGSIYRRVL